MRQCKSTDLYVLVLEKLLISLKKYTFCKNVKCYQVIGLLFFL